MKHLAIKKQQGAVLIWALAILLVLTLLGLSSVKKANMGTKVSGNSIASMMVFQGAESSLSKIANTKTTNELDKLESGETYTIPKSVLPDESVSGGSVSSNGNITFMETKPCPATNEANGASQCHIHRIQVESRLKGTGAKTRHVLGVAEMAVIPNAVIN